MIPVMMVAEAYPEEALRLDGSLLLKTPWNQMLAHAQDFQVERNPYHLRLQMCKSYANLDESVVVLMLQDCDLHHCHETEPSLLERCK
jgi:hypothetical protein